MRIPKPLLDEIVAHARDDAPNECCGVVGCVDGRATSLYPARNEFESPTRFKVHSDDLIEIYNRTEARGEEMAVLYHSHPKSEAHPSPTDINLSEWWPGATWVICSLAGAEPVVRAFEIEDGKVEEVEIVVADD